MNWKVYEACLFLELVKNDQNLMQVKKRKGGGGVGGVGHKFFCTSLS